MKKYILSVLLVFGFLGNGFIGCGNGSSPAGVTYTPFPTDAQYPSTYFTGVRGVEDSEDVYISGGYYAESGTVPLLYQGPLSGVGGTWYPFMPPANILTPGNTISSANIYGPDNSSVADEVNVVGTYQIEGSHYSYGFLYSGPPDASGSDWINLDPSSLLNPGETILAGVIPHSNMNGIVVGNFDTNLRQGLVFIYNADLNAYYELTRPGITSITAYGIWWNGGSSYTIAGGYRDPAAETDGVVAYLVDWNSETQLATGWQTYNYNNESALVTHFEGITGSPEGGYSLAADWLTATSGAPGAAYAHVARNADGSFATSATWTAIAYPGASSTTSNTVYEDNILGIFIDSGVAVTNPFVASIP